MITLIRGDARHLPLADGSVHCVICSPPYFGLRDYGTARWEGGDDEGCDHKVRPAHNVASSTLDGGQSTNGHWQEGYRDTCGKCGARRVDHQIGLEATPDLFVATMVAVFREVWRVLRHDGTAWVNLGDSYAATSTTLGRKECISSKLAYPCSAAEMGYTPISRMSPGLKPKDLLGMPWRVALALQADGWYLRSDIIWSKPNPMPESVTDRPTKSHEYMFLMSKCERYFYDSEAVRERGIIEAGTYAAVRGPQAVARAMGREPSGNEVPGTGWTYTGNRNLRSVWSIPTYAFPGAHFATFPPKLVEPCIKAGTSARGCCPRCGAGWVRETEVEYSRRRPGGVMGRAALDSPNGWDGYPQLNKHVSTLGWRPGCTCDAGPPVPCTVLDPFVGSGTTCVVASALGRRAIGCDLSAEYLNLARRRIERPHADVPRPARAEEYHPLFDMAGVSAYDLA